MKDANLMELIRHDPDRGMRKLVENYSGLVYSIVRAKLVSLTFAEADVEDCVADTFAEFYFDRDKFDPARGSVKSWLARLALNNALDLLRRRMRERNVPLEEGVEIADDFSLEGSFETKEERQALIDAVDSLPKPDREIIVRKFFLSQSSKEIAKKLNMTVANVDTRTHRAIKKLKTILGGVSV